MGPDLSRPSSTFRFLSSFVFPCRLASFLAFAYIWFWQCSCIPHIPHSRQPWHSPSPTELPRHLRPLPLPRTHLAHHCTHLTELLHQLVHFLHSRATTERDAFATAPVEYFGCASLLFRHRKHNGLDAFHLVAFQRLFHLRHRCHFVETR